MNGRATPRFDGGIPDGVPRDWVAECNACAPHGHVVMVFDSQAKRTDWAREHRDQLGHPVVEYQRAKFETTP